MDHDHPAKDRGLRPGREHMPRIAAFAWAAFMLFAGCGSDPATSSPPKPPVCNQPLGVVVLSNEIANTFYPGSKWEQAKDLLDPAGSYHKYGMTYRTTVRLRNLDDADLVVKSSVGTLMIKNEGMAQKSYQSTLPEFVLRARADTVVAFTFHVDIGSLSEDYFKLIASGETVGYFFKSAHKYSYASGGRCSDTSLAAHASNASDTTIKDYVSVPEITDATYNGAVTAGEATGTAARWSVDNWDTIQCSLMVIVLILGIVLGGHAGSSVC